MDLLNQTIDSISAAFNHQLLLLLPKLAAAATILLVGWIVSLLLGKIVATIGRKIGLDRASKSAHVNTVLANVGLRNIDITPSKLIGRLIFWLLMTVFFISATNTLGLNKLASLFDNVALFLPKLVAATMIFVFGLVLAQLFGRLVRKATANIGNEYSRTLGGFASSIISIVVVVLAIGQLEIDTTLLNIVIAIFLIILGIAVALSLGLGTRDLARNIVYGAYVRDHFQLGMPISFKQFTGKIIEINSVNTLIESNDGTRIYIPNSDLMNEVILSIPDKLD